MPIMDQDKEASILVMSPLPSQSHGQNAGDF